MAKKKTQTVLVEFPACEHVNGERLPQLRLDWKPRRRFIEQETKTLELLRRSLIATGATLDMGPDKPPRPVYSRPDVISWWLQEVWKATQQQKPHATTKPTASDQ